MGVRIADAAARLGMEAHVLRHWEDVGVVTPGRLSSGHRVYADDDIDRAKIVRLLQRAGLSLAQIRALGDLSREDRRALVEEHRAALRTQIAELQRTESFLAHTTACVHPIVAQCPECSAFVQR